MISSFRKLRWWIQRRDKEAELREELQFHLAEEAGEAAFDESKTVANELHSSYD